MNEREYKEENFEITGGKKRISFIEEKSEVEHDDDGHKTVNKTQNNIVNNLSNKSINNQNIIRNNNSDNNLKKDENISPIPSTNNLIKPRLTPLPAKQTRNQFTDFEESLSDSEEDNKDYEVNNNNNNNHNINNHVNNVNNEVEIGANYNNMNNHMNQMNVKFPTNRATHELKTKENEGLVKASWMKGISEDMFRPRSIVRFFILYLLI